MTPYRGKHRRTSADEEQQLAEVSDPGTTVSEDTGGGHSEGGTGRPEEERG
jgi:hypothetical protein